MDTEWTYIIVNDNFLINLIINNKDNFVLRAYAAPNPALTFFFFVATQRKRTKTKKKKHANLKQSLS